MQTDLPAEFLHVTKNDNTASKQDGVKVITTKKMVPYLFFKNKSILHFHNFSWRGLLEYRILALRHMTLLSLHNEQFVQELCQAPKILHKILINALNSIHYIIVDTQKNYITLSRIIKDKRKIVIIPEFIPPTSIPALNHHKKIIKMRKTHKYLISSTAWKIAFHNEQDLYGIDLLIQLTSKLFHDGMEIGFIMLIPQIDYTKYFSQLRDKIRTCRIQNRFLILTEPLQEASSLWKISDLFIRATNTDGNSTSILESLSVGTPVLASDCVQRPSGTLLFQTRNLDDLFEKTRHILSNITEHSTRTKQLRIENNADKFLHLYKDLVSKKMRYH